MSLIDDLEVDHVARVAEGRQLSMDLAGLGQLLSLGWKLFRGIALIWDQAVVGVRAVGQLNFRCLPDEPAGGPSWRLRIADKPARGHGSVLRC